MTKLDKAVAVDNRLKEVGKYHCEFEVHPLTWIAFLEGDLTLVHTDKKEKHYFFRNDHSLRKAMWHVLKT